LVTEAKKVFKRKRLNKHQTSILEKVCESVVIAKNPKDWLSTAKSCIKNAAKLTDLKPLKEVVDISAEHELNDYAAAILHHSRKDSLEK